MRKPGIEPGSKAWEASMLAVTPFALKYNSKFIQLLINFICIFINNLINKN